MYSQKKGNYCSGCDGFANSLVSLGCGHRLCIPCIKGSKTNNCFVCFANNRKKNRTSPDDSKGFSDQKTLKQKILDRVRSPSTAHQISQSSPDRSNRTYNLQSNQKSQKKLQMNQTGEALHCRQHSETLIMYCENNKQLYCAQCLYLKNTKNLHMLPIKNALEQIHSQNRLNREQSRSSLNLIENSLKICLNNRQLFETCIKQYNQIIEQQFEEIFKELKRKELEVKQNLSNLLGIRIQQYNKIIVDLEFMRNSLREYREYNNKENSNVNAAIYVFSAYKIIKKTIKTIDVNYIAYKQADISIIELDRKPLLDAISNYGKIKSDIPIKPYDLKASRVSSVQKAKKTSHMQSIKEQSQSQFISKPKEKSSSIDPPASTSLPKQKKPQQGKSRKQQFSLCNNVYEAAPEKNLYQRLLNEKFNKYGK